MCGRALKLAEECEAGDPAMDCGGDCWGCVGPIEAEMSAALGPIEDRIAEYGRRRVTPDGTEW